MANVFVSYRSADVRQAEQLAKELRLAGHDVWLDIWTIDIGDSIIERINEGLEGANHVILCYSSLGVTSSWMAREWMSSIARQLNGAGVKIIPVLLTGGAPPALLADLKYADLTKDWAGGVAEILKAIT